MKKYSLVVLLFALCTLVTAGGATWIEAPEGVLTPGSTGVFPISVGDLIDAQGIYFNLTFDSTVLSVESVSANNAIPGSSVTPNIDNKAGWVQVAVTNTEGITTEGAWWSIPFVDITFRSTGTEGESALMFAATPTYSQGEGFMPEEFSGYYPGSVRVIERPSTFQAPSGTLPYGQSGTFAVSVNNITDATEVWFELMYDGSYLVIDDIAPALPGAVITSADAYNGVYEDEEYGTQFLASVPEEVRLSLQQHHHGHNMASVYLEIPGGLTTMDYTDLVNVRFRPTNLAGASDIEFFGYYYTDSQSYPFDLQIPGRITTQGGGAHPNIGDFKAPSGTIDFGSQEVLPIMVQSLNNADEVDIWVYWDPTVVNITSTSLSATAQSAGVTLDDSWCSHYGSTGYFGASIGNLTNLNTASWTSLIDLTLEAKARSGQTRMTISGSAYMIPRENVTIMYQSASSEHGILQANATFLLGDANGDGQVDQGDTLFVLQMVVNPDKKPLPETEGFRSADVNRNGVIDVGDALFIAQYNAHLRDDRFELF